jgi:toxin ParE1/3/4
MEKYKIKIYKSARKDLEDIIEYINTLSKTAALKQYDHIVEKIGSLSEMPARCTLLKNTHLCLKGYRTLIVDNYIVFFIVKGDTVQIRRILYGKRNYEWML